MDTFDLGLAILSGATYREGRSPTNLIPADGIAIPTSQLREFVDPASGFEAHAYIYQGKLVIAFAGTYEGTPADKISDAKLGFGIPDRQLLLAAQYYEQLKALPEVQALAGAATGQNIIFTGHSLGGGLAALMGVFFNKPAVAFDEAPFRMSATQANANAIANHLSALRFAESSRSTDASSRGGSKRGVRTMRSRNETRNLRATGLSRPKCEMHRKQQWASFESTNEPSGPRA